MPDLPGNASVSRRRLATLIGGGALTGAIWTTGLTVLARGRHPQLFVLGSEEWQVVLIEHGANRVVLLLGEYDRSPEPEIDLLCGLLRQHIDVVVGDADALRTLSSTFRERRAVATVIETGSSGVGTGSARYRSLTDPITLRFGAFTCTIEPILKGEWMPGESPARDWIAHAEAGGITCALAPSMASISSHGRTDSTLAVAPSGAISDLQRAIPGIAVATNTREPFDATGSASVANVLVRTFRQDIASFVIKDGALQMPDWVEGTPTRTR